MNKDVSFSEINDVVNKSKIKNLIELSIFDVYEGDKIPTGKKSYGINFALSNNEKTLNEKEINITMKKITNAIVKEFNAKLRDN